MTRVGFVGAGRMGAPMVGRLVASGHDVVALGRAADKRQEVGQLGAHAVSTLPDVVDAADVVIVCVFTDDQVQQVCLRDGLMAAMQPGSALVIHTTGSPSTAQTIAQEFATIDVVDAPVSGGPHNIAAGEVTLFVGGADTAVERVRPVLASYGDPILHVGPLGAGQGVKLVNNALFAAHIGLLSKAVQLGRQLGVEESRLLESIGHGSGASRVGSFVAATGSVTSFIDGVGEFVGKDVAVVRQIAAELGTDLGVLDAAITAGFGP